MVSIILPSYNHSSFLKERLDSILNQTYKDFEIIILDDHSSDNSWECLNGFSKHEKVSHCIRNSRNSGSPFGLWKQGFSLAKGKYIWIAESDDVSHPNFLEILVDRLEHDESVLAHCRSIDFDVNYEKGLLNFWWNSFSTFIWDKDFILPGSELLFQYGRFKCPVVNVSSAIFKKEIIDDIIIPENMKYAGDWLFWNQIFLRGKVSFIASPLNYFRNHEESATSRRNSNILDKYIEYIYVIKFTNSLLGLELKYDSNYYWIILLWKKYFYSKKIAGFFYSIKYLPKSFFIQLFK